MANNDAIEKALHRARALESERMRTIEDLARTRQALLDAKEEGDRQVRAAKEAARDLMSDAEIDDVRAYQAATKAGWDASVLKRAGFDEPAKTARVRRRARRASAQHTPPPASTDTDSLPAEPVDSHDESDEPHTP